VDFSWAVGSAKGRITREMLPRGIRLREGSAGREPCAFLFRGPMVLADGTDTACYCAPQAMDANEHFGIGHIYENLDGFRTPAGRWMGEMNSVRLERASAGGATFQAA